MTNTARNMTPDDAADVLVRYFDLANDQQDAVGGAFPVEAFWVVIDHARAGALGGRDQRRSALAAVATSEGLHVINLTGDAER